MGSDATPPSEPMGLGNTFLEREGNSWTIFAIVDGIRKVISRHPTRELGELALRQYATESWPEERSADHRP